MYKKQVRKQRLLHNLQEEPAARTSLGYQQGKQKQTCLTMPQLLLGRPVSANLRCLDLVLLSQLQVLQGHLGLHHPLLWALQAPFRHKDLHLPHRSPAFLQALKGKYPLALELVLSLAQGCKINLLLVATLHRHHSPQVVLGLRQCQPQVHSTLVYRLKVQAALLATLVASLQQRLKLVGGSEHPRNQVVSLVRGRN